MLLEDRGLKGPHQHDVEHAVVGDEDVRGRLLHVPARPQFAARRVLEVVPHFLAELLAFRFRQGAVVALIAECRDARRRSPGVASASGRWQSGWASARRCRSSGTASPIRPSGRYTARRGFGCRDGSGPSSHGPSVDSKRPPQTTELVFHEGIERVEDDPA